MREISRAHRCPNFKDCGPRKKIGDLCSGEGLGGLLGILEIIRGRSLDCPLPRNEVFDAETQLLYKLFQTALILTSYSLNEDIDEIR